ncbi:ribokinase [Danxiaibacter flavus]|uniref:Ribokinase n=1 Tax=Danxiaibacter flavus TaxID=3049108 RepID=A0ABV3ZGW1_9BACT|nr:ribokinase [Chitinophagaceae bacterium DXS]
MMQQTSAGKIIVVGSSNTDMVIKTTHLPLPGETILGGTFFMNAGGKGANQAVAAARLKGNVAFIGKVGNDMFGEQARELFQKEGIDVSGVVTDAQHPSGVALITVDEKGENCIAVASGANANLLKKDIQFFEQQIQQATIILMQLETPLETIEHVAGVASSAGVSVILNPAPAARLTNDLLSNVAIITPNQTEAEILTGIAVTDMSSAEQAAIILCEKGIETVIITMGAKGAFLYTGGKGELIASEKVIAVDATAAGDVFNGALAVALSENRTIRDAVVFACKAAAISVTRLGAQSSAPYRNEINIDQ